MLGLAIIVIMLDCTILADYVAPYRYAEGDSAENYMIPEWMTKAFPGHMETYAQMGDKFILGADYLGRDLLSRIIYGARVSLPVGFMGAFIALVIGLVYGCVSGYLRRHGGQHHDAHRRHHVRLPDHAPNHPLDGLFPRPALVESRIRAPQPIPLIASTMWSIGSSG